MLNWQISIPPNSTGLVALTKEKKVTINGKEIDRNKFVPAGNHGETVYYRFPSGRFEIQEMKE